MSYCHMLKFYIAKIYKNTLKKKESLKNLLKNIKRFLIYCLFK